MDKTTAQSGENDKEKQITEQLNKLRNLCIKNAEDLLHASKLALENNIDHVSFHLSKLALEELGKLHIATLEATTIAVPRERKPTINFSTDDHERKLFFAIWSQSFGRVKQTKEQIEENQHLAKTIHERSLHYLYVEPEKMADWKEKMEKGEAKRLYDYVSVKVKYEKETHSGMRVVPEEEKAELKWFLNINEDLQRRKEIWGHKSQDKLLEMGGNVKEWIHWLKEIYDKNESEMREFAEQEIKRQKPSEKEAFDPKYKMRVRIQSQSHSIANDAFKKWNEGVKDIKIYKSDRKDAKKIIKSELLIDFLVPKAIPVAGLWEHGLFMSKTLVIAINIATKGMFWWNVQKDIETYYEEITDLDADKKENVKIGISIGKRLNIDWGPANMSLDQEEMTRVSMIFAFLMHENKKMEKFLKGYAMAMVLFSKTDIHLRLEVNAFDEFFKAFKEALLALGDWNAKDDIKDIIKRQFGELGELKDLDQTLDLGVSLDNDPEHKNPHIITLTEVAAIKLYCDFYIQMKANEYFKERKNK